MIRTEANNQKQAISLLSASENKVLGFLDNTCEGNSSEVCHTTYGIAHEQY